METKDARKSDDLLSRFRAPVDEMEMLPGPMLAMLVFKLLHEDGQPEPRTWWAFPYAILRRMELVDPGEMHLYFPTHRVLVFGNKIDTLFEHVAQHKVAVIRERALPTEGPLQYPNEEEIFVSAIRIGLEDVG